MSALCVLFAMRSAAKSSRRRPPAYSCLRGPLSTKIMSRAVQLQPPAPFPHQSPPFSLPTMTAYSRSLALSLIASLVIPLIGAPRALAQRLPRRIIAVAPAPAPAPAPADVVSVAGPRRFPRIRRAAAAALYGRFGRPAELPPEPAEEASEDARRNRRPRRSDEGSEERGPIPTLAPAPTPAMTSGAAQLPTQAELQAMSDSELLNALIATSQQLHERLGLLSTGEGWQRYLDLPAGALPPPAADGSVELGLETLAATLEKFDGVRANDHFQMIASLDSFNATHAVLQEVVGRFGSTAAIAGPVLGAPANAPFERSTRAAPAAQTEQTTQVETLPTPKPETRGALLNKGQERSVLKRTRRN